MKQQMQTQPTVKVQTTNSSTSSQDQPKKDPKPIGVPSVSPRHNEVKVIRTIRRGHFKSVSRAQVKNIDDRIAAKEDFEQLVKFRQLEADLSLLALPSVEDRVPGLRQPSIADFVCNNTQVADSIRYERKHLVKYELKIEESSSTSHATS